MKSIASLFVFLGIASHCLAAPFQKDLYCTAANNLWVMNGIPYKDWPGFDVKALVDGNFIVKPTAAIENLIDLGEKVHRHTLTRIGENIIDTNERLFRTDGQNKTISLRLVYLKDTDNYVYSYVQQSFMGVRLRTGSCYETE